MAGTIAALPLSQQNGSDGKPLAGWLLSVFEPNTSTPVTTYKDSGLTVGLEHPHPIEADANGRCPMFWVADGTYRIRGTNSAASDILFDEDNVLAIGPSSGEGGGGSSVDANAIAATGDMKFRPSTGTISGWVRANGRTIGSASSGAAERANADTEDLFTYLWNNFSNTICPVTGGRGANAAADWGANKPIAVIDMRGRVAAGVDDMGNSAASRITSATITNPTTGGSGGGAQTHTLADAEVPATSVTVDITDPGHSHAENPDVRWYRESPAAGVNTAGNGGTLSNMTIDSAFTGITAEGEVDGGGGAHNNVQPTVLGTWYLRL